MLCRNIANNSKIIAKINDRSFTTNHLKRTLANGEQVDRNWVIFSPSKNSIFCFMCHLFGTSNTADLFATDGFVDFRNITRSFKKHENSKYHFTSEMAYKTRSNQLNILTLDTSVSNQSASDMEYWKSILKRIMAVVKFLGARGLSFRGADRISGSVHNGNFLGILDLLSQFDPLIASHISRYSNKGKGIHNYGSRLSFSEIIRFHFNFKFNLGRASYLSDTICDEFIDLIGIKVLNVILSELREAKYFSISVDSTPDVSHCDQLVFCVRYVKNGVPIERFLQFIPIDEHKSEYLTETIVGFMEKHSINLSDCRGQSYDNANNMAGKYSGLQQRILERNKYAKFVPCAAHSLNLVGSCAVSGNKRAVSFFCFMESIYSFFVKSSFRWTLLKAALGPNKNVLKRATGTRWAAKFDSVSALNVSICEVKGVLLRLIDDDELQTTNENKALARGQLGDLCKFENIFMLKIWYAILSQFNKANLLLQKPNLNLSVAVQLYKGLINHLNDLKDQFNDLFNEAKLVYVKLEGDKYVTRSRTAITIDNIDEQKTFFLQNIFKPIVDSLITNLDFRLDSYVRLNNLFSFFVKLDSLNFDEISMACQNIASFYEEDIDHQELMSECEFAKQYFFVDLSPIESISHSSMYLRIVEEGLHGLFPNIEIALRIFLSLFITNVPGERAFSKLKYIKDTLRNRMTEDKLNAFSLISIEHEILGSLCSDEIIEEFALLKNRKININNAK